MTDLNNLIKKVEGISDKTEMLELEKSLSDLIGPNNQNIDLLRVRAALYIKLQQPAKAINDLQKILLTDKNDQRAISQIEMLKTILRYSGNDIYANPNTNLDPWLE